MKQQELFDASEFDHWRDHWWGMPEYISEDSRPIQSITIHFDTIGDRDEFARLVGQTITERTKYLWFPKKDLELSKGHIHYRHEP